MSEAEDALRAGAQWAQKHVKPERGGAALYHRVLAHETFDDAAQQLFELVRFANDRWPGKKRFLYLDIDGHTHPEDGFDWDMREVLLNFIPQVLGDYLSEFPYCDIKDGKLRIAGSYRNPGQSNDLPPELIIRTAEGL